MCSAPFGVDVDSSCLLSARRRRKKCGSFFCEKNGYKDRLTSILIPGREYCARIYGGTPTTPMSEPKLRASPRAEF